MEEQYDEYGNPVVNSAGTQAPQVSTEEAEYLLANRAQRFKSMNIPAPTPMPNQKELKDAIAAKSNPDKFRKMQEIMNGAKRGDFSKYIQKENLSAASSNLPVPKSRPGAPGEKKTDIKVVEHAPVAAAKSAEAERMEALLLGGYTPAPQKASRDNVQFNQPTEHDAEITSSRVHSKFQESMAKKATVLGNNTPPPLQQYQGTQFAAAPAVAPVTYAPQVAVAPGLILISEEDLNKKIASYAAAYCKKYVEKVMQPIQESIRQVVTEMKNSITGKGNLTETSKKTKQAEVVGDGVVLIDGVYYKKATVKKVSE